MRPNARTPRSELAQALGRCSSALWGVGLMSGLVIILMLTGPLFMFQVYDRVLPSRSVPTLVETRYFDHRSIRVSGHSRRFARASVAKKPAWRSMKPFQRESLSRDRTTASQSQKRGR